MFSINSLFLNSDNLQFIWPQVFWLLPLPLLIYFFIPALKKEQAALRIPTYSALSHLSTSEQHASHLLKLLLLLIIWALCLTASARPQWIGDPVQLPSTGRDLLLAVDISQSMETPDMVVNGKQLPRINVVKAIVNDFVQSRNGDRLGLVVFGTQAFLHVPLTFDRKIIGQQLQEAQLGFAGSSTAIGDAIALSVKKIRGIEKTRSEKTKSSPKNKNSDSNKEPEDRVLILLTDGANTAGEIEPREAAKLAQTAQIKIYTIGLGADSMIQKGMFFNREINPSRDLDEATLKYIADITGGQYFRAKNPKQLQDIYQVINRLEPLPQEAETFRPKKSLFYFPLGLAITLIFLWSLIQQLLIFFRSLRK